jgi:AbrB family looped-hinge helix DNA binding protein
MRTKVDSSGRLVIPARFRRQLGIADGGGEVELIDTPDGVLLRHIGPPVPRRDARGLAVVELGRPVTNGEVVAAVTAAANPAMCCPTPAGRRRGRRSPR